MKTNDDESAEFPARPIDAESAFVSHAQLSLAATVCRQCDTVKVLSEAPMRKFLPWLWWKIRYRWFVWLVPKRHRFYAITIGRIWFQTPSKPTDEEIKKALEYWRRLTI